MTRWIPVAVALLAACATPVQREKGTLKASTVSLGALEQAHRGKRHALVIGIGTFDDDGWRALRFAEKDARDVAAALGPSGSGFASIELLTSSEQTRRADVLAALQRLAARAKNPEDVALVYISSHGTLARDDRGELRRYLVTRDARVHDVAHTALSMDALQAELEKLGSRKRVLVLASCHSGTGKSLLPPDVAREAAGIKAGFYPRPLEEVSRVSMVLSASDWGEAAREDDTLENDIYTHFLLQALDGRGDRNLDGAVTATEAHDHARRLTYGFTGGRQRPSAEILEVGADPVVLAGEVRNAGSPELFSYSPRLDGFTVAIDGQAQGELPGGVTVAAGRRRIELTKGGQVLLQREVELRPGERVAVDAWLERRSSRRTVSLVGGAIGFVDAQSRAEVVPESLAAGVQLRLEDVIASGIGIEADLLTAGGAAALRFGTTPVPISFQAISAGIAAPATWRSDAWAISTGPRVAVLWVRRSFELETFAGAQTVTTLIPGWTAGAEWALHERWALTLGLDLSLAVITVDQQSQPRGLAGARAGVGYRF